MSKPIWVTSTLRAVTPGSTTPSDYWEYIQIQYSALGKSRSYTS